MSKGRGGDLLGVGGGRANLSRKELRGGRGGGRGAGGGQDPLAQKRELLRRLREDRADRT